MITDTGKAILTKYLLGQAPAYASYIAIGCGAKPLIPSESLGDYSAKNNLDFEMFRVPVTSRGTIVENGVQKIVLSAELPTQDRYDITEIGLYSIGTNPSAGNNDSKTIISFSTAENWEFHTGNTSYVIPIISDSIATSNIINYYDTSGNSQISSTNASPIQTTADNSEFNATNRIAKNERPRFSNDVILINGDMSTLTTSGGHLDYGTTPHIHLNTTDINLSQHSLTDELRIAFSVINRNGATLPAAPGNVKMVIEFGTGDPDVSSPPSSTNKFDYARFEIDQAVTDSYRYIVSTKQLKDLYSSSGFNWNDVNYVRIFAAVYTSGGSPTPSSNYIIALDAIRIENTSAYNPLYGLTGYTVIKNSTYIQSLGSYVPYAITKKANASNSVEFRFIMDVS